MDDPERIGPFTEITNFHDLVRYVEDWDFKHGKIGRDRTRLLPVQYIDTGTMEGQALEVGITEWNGELQISLAPEGTFS